MIKKIKKKRLLIINKKQKEKHSVDNIERLLYVITIICYNIPCGL